MTKFAGSNPSQGKNNISATVIWPKYHFLLVSSLYVLATLTRGPDSELTCPITIINYYDALVSLLCRPSIFDNVIHHHHHHLPFKYKAQWPVKVSMPHFQSISSLDNPRISSQVGGNEAWLLGFYLQTYGVHDFSN